MKHLFSLIFILSMSISTVVSQDLGAEVHMDPDAGTATYTVILGPNRIHQRHTPGSRLLLSDSLKFFNFRLADSILQKLYIEQTDTLRTFFDPSNKLYHIGGHFEVDSSLRIPLLVIPKNPNPDSLKRTIFSFKEPGVFFIEFPGFTNDLFGLNFDPDKQQVNICDTKELKMKLDNIIDILWELDSDDKSGTLKVTDEVTGEVLEMEMDPEACTQTVRHVKGPADDVLEHERLFDEAVSQMRETLRVLESGGGSDTSEIQSILDAAQQTEALVGDATQYQRTIDKLVAGLFTETVVPLPNPFDPTKEMTRTLDAMSGSESLVRDSLLFVQQIQEAQRILAESIEDSKSGRVWMEAIDPNNATLVQTAGDTLQHLLQIDDAANVISQAFVHDANQVMLNVQPELHQLELVGAQPVNMVVHGNFQVLGGAKNFKIDHPLDPENKYLVHASIESPEMMNIYNGNVTTDGAGLATVLLPEYFSALNKDFRYQLTIIGGGFAQAIVKDKIDNNQFTVQTSKPGIEVSWQVTGVRQDRYAREHPMEVEVEK